MATAIKKGSAKNVDEYLETFPSATQAMLKKIRKIIKANTPRKTEEVISYGIAGYKYHGMLIFFAGFAKHVSIYPAPRTAAAFKKELAAYKGGKGTVQFPVDKPLPVTLIKKIIKFRLKQNLEKALSAKIRKASLKKAALKKPTAEMLVKIYLNKLNPKVKGEINAVRKIIAAASPKLSERIKWNAPSYYYKEDIVTFGPYKNNKILLVFHHLAVVKVKSKLLIGDYKDRRLVYFNDKAEAGKNKKELTRIIKEIIKSIDKK